MPAIPIMPIGFAIDRAEFRRAADVFREPEALRLGVIGAVQIYQLSNSFNQPIGEPLLIVSDGRGGHERKTASAPGEAADMRELARKMAGTGLERAIDAQMIDVSTEKSWIFSFPDVVILQADDIAQELQAVRSLGRPLSISDWARSAIARIGFEEPESTHAQLHLMSKIAKAVEIMGVIRPEALAVIASEGCILAPVTREEIAQSCART